MHFKFRKYYLENVKGWKSKAICYQLVRFMRQWSSASACSHVHKTVISSTLTASKQNMNSPWNQGK